MTLAYAFFIACQIALAAWAIWLLVRPIVRANALKLPKGSKLRVGIDLSSEGDRTVLALARISPEGAREHVHVFEDADWSAGIDSITTSHVPPPPRDVFAAIAKASEELASIGPLCPGVEIREDEWPRVRDAIGVSDAPSTLGLYVHGLPVRIVPIATDPYPHDEVTEVVRITDPVKR